MQIHQLIPNTPNKKSKSIGRGGKRGKTSGRGTKGQRARAGHRIRPELRDLIKKIPKQRGYRFHSIEQKMVVINLSSLEKNFEANAKITPTLLVEKKLISARLSPSLSLLIKVLGTGNLSKPLIISGCAVSAPARVKIEAVGGQVLK